MSLMNMNNLAHEVLCIFGRTMNFMQNVGMIEAYSFNHSNIFFCTSAEKYLENFIAILEEIKDIVEKLKLLQKQQKVVDSSPDTNLASGDLISASNFIQNNEIFAHDQLMAPHDELGSFITPPELLNTDFVPEIIHEPALESSWVPSEEKQDEPVQNVQKEVLEPTSEVKEQFQCPVCSKVLSSKTTLHFHEATHTGQKPFCCEHCGKLFTTNVNLAAHLTRQHNLNTESANSCKECGKLFVRKSALDVHLKSHLGIKPWTCYICDKGFTQKITRDTHQLTHSRDYKFTCNDCGKTFPTKAKLNCHSKMHGEPQFPCYVCGKKFALKQYLNAHYRAHHKGGPKTAQCRLDSVPSQVMEMENNSFTCSQCNCTFTSEHKLTTHMQSHNLSARFRYNEKRKMAPRQKHSCIECGKQFLHRASLAHHHVQKHSSGLNECQLKPFCCHICHKRFTLRSKAQLHMLIHTKKEKHSCMVCGRAFLRKDSLQRHMSQHNSTKEPSQGQYSCTQCDKIFRSKTALNFHLHTHNGKFKHQCNICGKQFVRKCHYQDHLLTHSSDRPYKCDICGKAFKNTKNCWEHTKRVHSSQPTARQSAMSTDQLSGNQVVGDEVAASQLAIHTLLAGDDATYGQTYDQFQACVQLQ